MKVILQQDIKKIGKQGDIINVSDGYARNYLFPRKLAVEATQGAVKTVEQKKTSENKKQAEQLAQAKEQANRLTDKVVKLCLKAGEAGRLFGAVTTKDIADALAAQHKITIDKRKFEIKEPLKTLGRYQVIVRLYPEVSTQIQVDITAQ